MSLPSRPQWRVVVLAKIEVGAPHRLTRALRLRFTSPRCFALRKAFDEEEVYASLAIQIAKIRQEKNLTQQGLAKRLQTTQQNISRLEDIDNRSCSLKTLNKVAHVLGKRLKVELV